MWRHHGHQAHRRGFAEQEGHRFAKPRACKSFFEKMPHLVERDHDLIGADGWLGKLARFSTDPVQDGDVADAENAGNAAKAHVAHGVEQQHQSLHLWRLASGRRRGEIASARLASVALHLAHDSILHITVFT